jgi:hypothetical protein
LTVEGLVEDQAKVARELRAVNERVTLADLDHAQSCDTLGRQIASLTDDLGRHVARNGG